MPGDVWVNYRKGGTTAPVQPASTDPAPPASALTPPAPAPTQTAPVQQPTTDPWANYKAGSSTQPSAPAAQPLTPTSDQVAAQRDPSWKPSGNALWDAITYPRAKKEDFLPALTDAGLSFGDALTMHGATRFLGAQDAVAQARQNLGVMDPLVQGMGYIAGPGKILGPAARGIVGAVPGATSAAAPLATRIAASAASGGLEGAAAGGGGTAIAGGSGSDIAKNAGWGGTIGALIGGLFGGSGPPPKAPEVGTPGTGSSAPTGMYANKATEYAPLDSTYFDTPNAALAKARTVIAATKDPANKGADLGISDDVTKITSKLASAPAVTGANIQEAARQLQQEGSWQANRYRDQLLNVLKNDQPIQGGAPGDAWQAKTSGDLWNARINDLNRLSKESSTGQPGPTPGNIQTTKDYYNQGSPQHDALSALQKADQPGFNWWKARHAVAPVAFGGASLADQYLDPNNEHPMLRDLLHAGTAASMFEALPAMAAARPGPAINAARYSIGTGNPISTPTGRVGNSLLQLMLGNVAGNQ